MDTTYINGYDEFIAEENTLLVTDDEAKNANHILLVINSGRNFGLLCPSKPTETKKGNEDRMKSLQQDVIRMKCSYIPFKYGFNFTSEGESIIRKEETCLFILGIKLDQLLALANTYEQDTAVYGNKEEIKSYSVSSGKPEVILGSGDMKLAMATVMFYPGTYR